MCCSRSVSKVILVVLNLIFFLLGGGALGLGVFLIVDETYLLSILGNIPTGDSFDVETVISSTSFLENGAYMLIGAGGFVFIIAFCGLCGGLKESKCLLYVSMGSLPWMDPMKLFLFYIINMMSLGIVFQYSVVLFLILALQFAVGVLCYFFSDDVDTYLQTWLTALVTGYYYGATIGSSNTIELSSDSTGISDAIDFIQVSLQCCGVTNYTDFSSATNWAAEYNYTLGGSTYTLSGAAVPVSCCMIDNPSSWPADMASITFVDLENCLTTGAANSTNLDSCYSSVKDLLVEYSTITLGIGIGVACLELFGLLAACCVIRSKDKNEVTKVQPA